MAPATAIEGDIGPLEPSPVQPRVGPGSPQAAVRRDRIPEVLAQTDL